MGATPSASRTISLDVNGEAIEYDVPARRLLVHFIRDDPGSQERTSAATRGTVAPARSTSTAPR